jgi:hypothetical protein
MGEYRMCLSGFNSSFILTVVKINEELNPDKNKLCSPLSDILEVIK